MTTTTSIRPDEALAVESRQGQPDRLVRALPPGLAGARDVLPLVVGVVPLAMVIGVTARATGIDLTVAWAGSFLLIAGSAQLSLVQMLSDGAGPLSIVATVTAVNARFVVYSLGFRRWFEDEPLGRRLLLAFPLVDQLYLVCQQRFATESNPSWRRRYYLGAAGVLVGCWSAAQALSMAFAGSLPPSAMFEIATPLVFLGFLVPAIVDRSTAATVAAAAVATVAGSQLPFHSGLVAGIACGVLAGIATQERQ
ncbi:MAG TPA: AzlC family ABC transporter permease [Acidimicrobiales bacterium]